MRDLQRGLNHFKVLAEVRARIIVAYRPAMIAHADHVLGFGARGREPALPVA